MSFEWLIIRGSGIAAFALLSAAMIWGLLVSTKLVAEIVKAKPLTWFHESLGIGALIATLVHVGVLSVHEFFPFTWGEILVPGASSWKPMVIALGTLAFYGLTVLSLSFYFRKWIGQKTWRLIHFASFGVFLAALLHGIQAGTDTDSLFMLGLYAGCAIAVFALAAQRLLPSENTAKAQVRPAPPVGQVPENGASTAEVSTARSGSE